MQKLTEPKYEQHKNKKYAQAGFDGNFYVCSACHSKANEKKYPLLSSL